MKKKLLNGIFIFLLLQVILFSLKIVDYASLGNSVLSSLLKQPYCKGCNVILISLDTLGANHLPCYGYNRNTSPYLCKFGNENIMFRNMFSNSNYTLSSHASIFTGLYPNKHGVNIPNLDRLAPSISFLPEILQKNGYKTYFYMPLNDTHLPVDFVYYKGIDKIVNAPPVSANWMNGIGQLELNDKKDVKTFLFLHTYWVHSPYMLNDKSRRFYADDSVDTRLPESLTELETCSQPFIDYLKKALERDFVNETYAANSKLLAQYKNILSGLLQATKDNTEAQFCNVEKNKGALGPYFSAYYEYRVNVNIPQGIDHQRNLYDSKIAELDEYLHGIFTYIENSKLKQNTIIIVTSDHGEEFMEHGKWKHGYNLYDTNLKVPLMMYVPGYKNKEVTDTLAQSVDILPTLLSLLKIDRPKNISGSNLFDSHAFAANKTAIAQNLQYKRDNQYDNVEVIRDSQWKLFYYFKRDEPIGLQLFNYKSDPLERKNLIFKYPDIVEKLLRKIPK